jgi:uncharacterized protein (TIGR00255 family)
MLRSMTGFASKIITIPLEDDAKLSMVISIKSLNSRFFETTCKVPPQLGNIEASAVKLMKTMLYRGHIYFTIYTNNANAFKGGVEPSMSVIGGYIDAIKKAQEVFGIQGSLSLDNLLLLPNAFSIEDKELDAQKKERIEQTVAELIELVIAEQVKEGAALYDDIKIRIAHARTSMQVIEETSKTLILAQKEKVKAALQEEAADESKLAELQRTAAYMTLEKMDINEEIVRFKSHLANFEQQLTAAGIEKGKRLDFTLQELAREINTIAAKCSDATIGAAAIDIKVELEKAREQVQNVV